MTNPSENKQQPLKKDTEKPRPSSPSFGDQPWQNPDYGEEVSGPEEPAK